MRPAGQAKRPATPPRLARVVRPRPGRRTPQMNAEDWLSAYAEELGTNPPTPAELETLLALAGAAAHASERRAAPVACWIAARAGVPPEGALALARKLGEDRAAS
jgi:hypothetical protein